MSLDELNAGGSALATEISPGAGDGTGGGSAPAPEALPVESPEAQPTEAQPTEQPLEQPVPEQPLLDGQPSPLPNEIRALMGNAELMANPLVAGAVKNLQSAYDRLNAYASHFPTVGDAKKFTEAFPGGVPDALAAQEKAQKLDNSDAVFYSRDPQQHRELATGWQQDDPQAYASLIRSGMEVLHDADPEQFRAIGLDMLEQTLANMQQAAYQRNDQEAAQRLSKVHEDIFGRKPGEQPRTDPRDTQFKQRERQQQEREQGFLNQVAVNFMETSNDTVGAKFKTTIETAVAGLLKGIKVTDGQKSRLVADIYGDINTKLRADTALQNQISAIVAAGKRAGKFTPQDQQKYVNAIYAKAQSLLRSSGPQFINDWTATFLNVKRADTAKREAAGTRTDVTGGGSPNFGTKPLTGAQLLDMSQEELNKVPSQLIPSNWRQLMKDERLRRQAV